MHSTPARFKGHSLCAALPWIIVMCGLHTKSLLIITPSDLVDVTLSIVFSLIVIVGISGGICHRNTRSSCVLSQFTHTMLLSYHSTASSAVCWIWLLTADGEHTSHSCIDGTLSSLILFRCSLSHKNEVTSRNVFHSEQIYNILTCFQFDIFHRSDYNDVFNFITLFL